eukprot:1203294-Pleurochrysis_carterae.AAC.2
MAATEEHKETEVSATGEAFAPGNFDQDTKQYYIFKFNVEGVEQTGYRVAPLLMEHLSKGHSSLKSSVCATLYWLHKCDALHRNVELRPGEELPLVVVCVQLKVLNMEARGLDDEALRPVMRALRGNKTLTEVQGNAADPRLLYLALPPKCEYWCLGIKTPAHRI